MATLVKNNDKVWKQQDNEDFSAYLGRTSKIIEELKTEERLIQFPCADSAAYYEVVSKKPLKLKHLPFCDAWEADYSQIRGLRLPDVEQKLEWERYIRDINK